jgi:lipopolysaccharide/colanic/teichoic acid biosynthesis glycosyltransferase
MLKRSFDFVVSLAVILIALPLWLAVAVAIKLDSPGPIFHRAIRSGKDSKPFTLYKFRRPVWTSGGWWCYTGNAHGD